jgi:hypothetical protein
VTGQGSTAFAVTLERGAAEKRCMFRERFLAEKPLVPMAG